MDFKRGRKRQDTTEVFKMYKECTKMEMSNKDSSVIGAIH